MPVETFDLLLSEHIRKHIIQETVKYAEVCQNDSNFSMTEFDLRINIVSVWGGIMMLILPWYIKASNEKNTKVRSFYDIANKSQQQFGYWHVNNSID